MDRKYYSQRNGVLKISLDDFKSFLKDLISDFYKKRYFCEKLKLNCCIVIEDEDISAFYKRKTRNMWSLDTSDFYEKNSVIDLFLKEEIFDLIEFLFDYCIAKSS